MVTLDGTLRNWIKSIGCDKLAPRWAGIRDVSWIKDGKAEGIIFCSNCCADLDLEDALKVLRLVDLLESSDDVQDVYFNADIPEEAYEAEG